QNSGAREVLDRSTPRHMYHAPVPLDPDQQDGEPSELGDANVGADVGSRQLSEAHLQNGQAEARALFAPFFAITSVGAALLVGWSLLHHQSVLLIGGWLAAVAGANWAYYRVMTVEGSMAGSRSARRRTALRPIAEALGL